jgi:predicted nucleic acid-binding protein
VIVVDASAIVELLLKTDVESASAIADRCFAVEQTMHAPHLLDVEVAQVLRRYRRFGEVSAPRGRQAVEDLARMPLERYSHQLLLPRIWELRHNASAYDAAYLALAEALEAPLLTLDSALATVPGHSATVEVLR